MWFLALEKTKAPPPLPMLARRRPHFPSTWTCGIVFYGREPGI